MASRPDRVAGAAGSGLLAPSQAGFGDTPRLPGAEISPIRRRPEDTA